MTAQPAYYLASYRPRRRRCVPVAMRALATIHHCPTCDTWTCAPEYQRVPHTCRSVA